MSEKNKIALITGASSGIGRDLAIEFAKKNYDLIVVARSIDKLEELKKKIAKEYNVNVQTYMADVSDENACKILHKFVKEKYKNIDVLVNNAGFGLCGQFVDTDLDTEVSMIKTNVIGLHILTKLFLQDMVKRDSGYILNVASIASFMPGPLMATYYSTKAYVLRLTQSIRVELKKMNSNVKISALCPGPVNTNFNNVANVKFAISGQSSEYVAKNTVSKMEKGKTLIFPSLGVCLYRGLVRILPDNFAGSINYKMQKRKIER